MWLARQGKDTFTKAGKAQRTKTILWVCVTKRSGSWLGERVCSWGSWRKDSTGFLSFSCCAVSPAIWLEMEISEYFPGYTYSKTHTFLIEITASVYPDFWKIVLENFSAILLSVCHMWSQWNYMYTIRNGKVTTIHPGGAEQIIKQL